MDCSDVAKKYGIIEYLPEFFEDECLKFYSKNDLELIEQVDLPRFNLFLAGYEYDENDKYYIKTNNVVEYEFNEKRFKLYENNDCFIYHIFLCNYKLKKFRNIILSDIVDFPGDGVYVYKDKYYCHYYEAIKSLVFFNRNQFITLPGLFIMPDLKKPNGPEFVSKYFDIKDGQGHNQPNVAEFFEADDEAISVHFGLIYRDIMIAALKMENPIIYKNIIEKDEEEINSMKNIDDMGKCALKIYHLYGHHEFRDFCNTICSPEIFNKELLKNGEVRKNLKNNFWIYHEFKSSLRDPNNDFIAGEDFTFLIINAIKSLEYLLYRKMCNYKDFKQIEYDDKITEKTMLDNLIYYIKHNRQMFRTPNKNVISKDTYNSLVKSYIDLLYYVKNECRNGYFHKHRIDNYEKLCEKREKVLEAIAKTIIFLK